MAAGDLKMPGFARCLALGVLGLAAWCAAADAMARPAQTPNPLTASAADVDFVNRHHWRLVSAVSGPTIGPLRLPQDVATQPVMRFHPQASAAEGYMFITNVCNGAGIAYRLTSDRRIHEVLNSNMAFTLKACEEGAMALERRMQMQLKLIHSFAPLPSANGAAPKLALRFSDGALWLFEGSLALEARHGPPIELRLEIAPEPVPCAAGQVGKDPAQCLKVRRVLKNDAPCPTALEDWQVYSGQIQGFSYAPGYRYELDIKRYVDRRAPPGQQVIDVKVGISATMVGDVRKLFGERAKNMPPFSFDRCK